jgi:hypothetical protein
MLSHAGLIFAVKDLFDIAGHVTGFRRRPLLRAAKAKLGPATANAPITTKDLNIIPTPPWWCQY